MISNDIVGFIKNDLLIYGSTLIILIILVLGFVFKKARWVMLPILIWVWLAARDPFISAFNGTVPRHIIGGELFSAPFHRVHAGFSLDQPTIGKWLFWFSVMTASSLPYAAVIRWLSNRTKRSGYLAYGTCVLILGVFLLCILSWPLCWLIQYVCSMGPTSRRIYGILYTAIGGLLVMVFMWWAVRRPGEKNPQTRLKNKTLPY